MSAIRTSGRLVGSDRECSGLRCETEVIQTASRRTEEMERGVLTVSRESRVFFRSISQNLCDTLTAVWCLLDFRTKGLSVQ